VKQPLADALEQARTLTAAAETRAREIVAQAEQEARSVRETAFEQGRQEGAEQLARAWVRLRREEATKDEREISRSIDLARAMSERLIGEALRIDPEHILSLAKEALRAARKARRIVVVAHPEDAAVLARDVGVLGLENAAIEIHADAARARGSLLFHTDLGTLDADLSLQLDRLATALREGQEAG
jgi:flagellar biosynthesis/type III secretory pathway protein FliH